MPTKAKSSRKRGKSRMSTMYPRVEKENTPAAPPAKATPLSPVLASFAATVERVFSPQKRVPAATPTPAPTPVPAAPAAVSVTPAPPARGATITSADGAESLLPPGPSPAARAAAAPARARERCACFPW
jgi:hypothetical protein